MQWWSGSALALVLMLLWIGVGHAFSLGPDRIDGAAGSTDVRLEPTARSDAPEAEPALDELRLTPVPEPSTLLQLSLGLGGLALLGSRFREEPG